MRLLTLIKHDWIVGSRQRYDIAIMVCFTLFSALLFPFAIGSEPTLLSRVAVGLLWVLLVFATQLSIPIVWRQDIEDGTLEQLLLSDLPIEIIVASKVIILWGLCVLATLLTIPFFGYSYGLSFYEMKIFMLVFTIASLPLSLLGITGATLSLGHPRASLLSIILMIPLYIPLVIFSSSCVTTASIGEFDVVFLYILILLTLLMTPSLFYTNVLSLKWLSDL